MRRARTTTSGVDRAPALLSGALILCAVCFNAGLAFINANVMPLPAESIIASEIVIVAAALLIALIYFEPQMLAWFLLLALLIAIFLARSLVTAEIAPKYARDALLIPAFIVLGMAAGDRALDRIVLVVFAVVIAVAAFEVLAPEAYAAAFRIQDFYIQTRGARLEDFYTSDSDLFISAVRPDSRLFSFLELPRLSSVFLEPVSLGNYCSIMTAYLCARHRHIGLLGTGVVAAGIVALLLGCDGRLATSTSVLIAAVTMLMVRRLPPYAAMLYLPVAVAAAGVLVSVTGADAFADDTLGRLARSVALLQRYEAADWFGLSDRYLLDAADSGIAYLIATQSIIGVLVLWAFLALLGREQTLQQARFKTGALIYVALTMLVSYSLFTIKTAALLWFVFGALQSSPARVALPLRHGREVAHA
jgi:putative polymerase